MARKVNRLTAVTVSKATKPGYHSDGAGLYLRVGPTGAKHWSFRYRKQGKLYDIGLGPTHTVSLKEARAKALELRKLRNEGHDPRAVRRRQRLAASGVVTFRDCADQYIEAHRTGWAAKTADEWSTTLLTYAHTLIGDLPVSEVDTSAVMRVLGPLWASRVETASRLRTRIESVLDYAKTSGWREGENPARWRGHLENVLPKKSRVRRKPHHPALPYSEIAEFMAALRRMGGTAARALEFVVLTAVRTGEVRGAKWGEINLKERVWTVPADRMKMKREHRVPLSAPAVELLERLFEHREGDFVFAGLRGQLSNRSMSAVIADRMPDYGNRITVHGFRSTFRDWASEETAFPNFVCEMALAHAIPDGTEAAYRRGDLFAKRRDLMEEWARYCGSSNGVYIV